jgi:hypothetical protein
MRARRLPDAERRDRRVPAGADRVVIVFALNPTPYIAFPPVGVTLRWFVEVLRQPRVHERAVALARGRGGVVVLCRRDRRDVRARDRARQSAGRAPSHDVFLSPLMLPAILTGLALFQLFHASGVGRPVWGLSWATRWSRCPTSAHHACRPANFDRRIEEAAAMPRRLARAGVLRGHAAADQARRDRRRHLRLHRLVRPVPDLAVPGRAQGETLPSCCSTT